MKTIFLLFGLFALTVAQNCGGGQWECANGNCIPELWVCDNDNDCGDGSDEESEMCRDRPCPGNQFKCPESGRCISNNWVCDTDNDCGDWSDESIAICHPQGCNASRLFECGNDHCISENLVCNDIDNCGDGSDETNELCFPDGCTPPNNFECDNGKCIRAPLVCNEVDNCGDRSDERDCPCPRPGDMRCPDGGPCIPGDYWCDGVVHDCPDGGDEDPAVCNDFKVSNKHASSKARKLFNFLKN